MDPNPLSAAELAKVVDDGILDFEHKAKKQDTFKESKVKRNAAEKDLLKSAEELRDLLMDAVKGDKKLLEAVFGGDCERFWRVKTTMDPIELSGDNSSDSRWVHLQEAMAIVEEVLKSLGKFVPWRGNSAPDSLTFKDVSKQLLEPENELPAELPTRLVPRQRYTFQAFTTGCKEASLSFTVQPKLPPGLVLDPHTGEISGLVQHYFSCEESTWTVTAENVAGKCTATLTLAVKPVPPPEMVYGSKKLTATIGEEVNLEPVSLSDGGPVDSYGISPTLPAGLSLDPQTGVISGTPSHSRETAETFTVTSKNKAGESMSTFTLHVQDAPPTEVRYPDMEQGDLALGQVCYFIPEVTIGNLNSGGRRTMGLPRDPVSDLKFECSPPLPKGLHLASKTGIITGRPEEDVGEQSYNIVCSNASGESSVDVRIGVIQKAPARLEYPEVPEVIYAGETVRLTPDVENMPNEWAIHPALPEGLRLDPQLGQISGTPGGPCDGNVFMVTASNQTGSCQTELSLTVRRRAPSLFVYENTESEYPVGKLLGLVPTVVGTVDEFSIDGELPKGLEFDPNTGRISGTPLEACEAQSFKLEAKNESGAAKATLAFEIKEMPPSDLHYPRVDSLYHVGERVDCKPALVGGATEWRIEPALPDGMTFDETNGGISGVPTREVQDISYTVTASNATGGTSTVIGFSVAVAAPESLSYPMHQQIFVSQPVLIEPELQGVVDEVEVTYACAPGLPDGLDFDAKTGTISGVPECTSTTMHNITASTSGGSVSSNVDLVIEAASYEARSGNGTAFGQVDPEYVAMLEETTDISQLPKNPGIEMKESWMLWMVHRVYLNDPALEVLDFTGMQMPLPNIEPRVAPKLMKALAYNTYLKKLLLANSNLRTPQAHSLAEAIAQNMSLQELNIECNCLNSEALKTVAHGLTNDACNGGQLSIVRMSNQLGLERVGRPTEEAVAEAMQANKVITRLGFVVDDPHWNNVISSCLIRNGDQARRRRKGLGDGSTEASKRADAKERSLEQLVLTTPPEEAIWEIFDDDDGDIRILRSFIFDKRRLPTSKQLQAFAAGLQRPIPYSKVAPLLKEFHTKLLDASKGNPVKLTHTKGDGDGTLIAWSEKNQRWCIEVHDEGSGYFKYLSETQIEILVSESLASWVKPA